MLAAVNCLVTEPRRNLVYGDLPFEVCVAVALIEKNLVALGDQDGAHEGVVGDVRLNDLLDPGIGRLSAEDGSKKEKEDRLAHGFLSPYIELKCFGCPLLRDKYIQASARAKC
jgi:hypothetical protein